VQKGIILAHNITAIESYKKGKILLTQKQARIKKRADDPSASSIISHSIRKK
jgi:hypothetical protein